MGFNSGFKGLNTVAKVPRNFADTKSGKLILVDNFLFSSAVEIAIYVSAPAGFQP